MITDGQYLRALVSDTCISCGKHITFWDKVRRITWAPVLSRYVILWKVCCSRECWFNILEEELELTLSEIRDEKVKHNA